MAIYSDVITLVGKTMAVNDYGDMVATETLTTVFCEVRSISQSEFYQANANGFKPEIKFVLSTFADYSGQPVVRYKSWTDSAEQDYKVIRTYRNGEQLEITCQRGVEK